ncbi:MAG: hypothetical protein RLZZ623_1216 [Actinomycetota bacterium]
MVRRRGRLSMIRNQLLALGCLPFVVGSQVGTSASAVTCDAFLDKALTRMEKSGEQRWRDAVIGIFADAPCVSLEGELRTAFRTATAAKDVVRRDHLLAQAASAVLGPACTVQDPTTDARLLATACPLPKQPELQISHELRDILAVDYLVLNAIATRLLAGNEYDASAKRLVMDFALSASLRGERARESKRGAKRRR